MMGYGRFHILSLILIFLSGCLLVNLLIFTSEYIFVSSPSLLLLPLPTSTIPVEVTFLLSNRLSSSNASDWQSSVLVNNLPANDSSQLLNITDFKFLINVPCADTLYVVCVHSAPENDYKRQLIRNSWGAYVPVYFMLAETSPSNQRKINVESSNYHDIVQGKFIDSYTNMTYKHTMLFKWVVYFCPHVKYVLKVDDDLFINVKQLDDYLSNELSPYGIRNLLMCPEVYCHELTIRSYRSKWRVSFKDYSERYYPPYCKGPAILYSPDLIFKLYQLLQEEQTYLWVDDFFITGKMFEKLNMTHSKFDWFQEQGPTLLKVYTENDLQYYDPKKNLFVLLLNDPINTKLRKMFWILNKKTFGPSNHSFSSIELLGSENPLSL